MTKWTAETAGGSAYEYDNGFLRVFKNGSHTASYKPIKLVSIPSEVSDTWVSPNIIDWGWIREAPPTEVAEVGTRLYMGTLSEWRISSPIVSINIEEE